jgi:tetratricopeptide (TPR) repeat protein
MWRVLLFGLSFAAAARAEDEVDALIRLSRWSEAVPAAIAAADARPGDLDAHERLIDLLLSLGKPAEATQRYQERVDAHPSDADAWYLLGRAHVAAESSRSAYRRALEIEPDHARAWMGLGGILRVTGDPRGGAAAYQEALKRDPTLGEAWSGLLQLVIAGGDRAAIVATATAATQSAPGLAEGWLALAGYSPADAPTALRAGAKAAPNDARIRVALAEQLLAEGAGAEALEQARAALALDRTAAPARLAVMYARSMSTGALDAAGFAAVRAAIAEEAKGPEAALTAWTALIRKYPRSAIPLIRRASFLATRDPAAAKADLETARRLDPQNEEANAALGLLLQSQGDHARAIELLTAALRERDDDASLTIALARSIAETGRVEDAEALYVAAQSRLPQEPTLAIAHAELVQRLGNPVRATDLLRDAWKRTGDARVLFAWGVAARSAERWDEAARVFQSLAEVTGKPELAQMAKELREKAEAERAAN